MQLRHGQGERPAGSHGYGRGRAGDPVIGRDRRARTTGAIPEDADHPAWCRRDGRRPDRYHRCLPARGAVPADRGASICSLFVLVRLAGGVKRGADIRWLRPMAATDRHRMTVSLASTGRPREHRSVTRPSYRRMVIRNGPRSDGAAFAAGILHRRRRFRCQGRDGSSDPLRRAACLFCADLSCCRPRP